MERQRENMFMYVRATWTRDRERRDRRDTVTESHNWGALTPQDHPTNSTSERPSRLRPREPQRDDLVSIEVRDVDLVAVDNDGTDGTTTQLEGCSL